MSDLNEFHKVLDENPDDWPTRAVISDWHNDQGTATGDLLAAGYKWLADKRVAPGFDLTAGRTETSPAAPFWYYQEKFDFREDCSCPWVLPDGVIDLLNVTWNRMIADFRRDGVLSSDWPGESFEFGVTEECYRLYSAYGGSALPRMSVCRAATPAQLAATFGNRRLCEDALATTVGQLLLRDGEWAAELIDFPPCDLKVASHQHWVYSCNRYKFRKWQTQNVQKEVT